MTEPTLPMSSAQQGMYFDSQLRQSADYHITIELRTEHLSCSRLTQAVSAVMAEQPALRASVTRNDSGPVYMIADSVEAPVRHHDLTGAEENLDEIFHTARHTPFHLNTAPLFRVVAARLSDGDRLLVVCHHLIADGQSVSILADRIITLARGAQEITASRTDQGLFTYQNGQLAQPAPEALARRESFWSENLPRHRVPQLDHWLLASPHEDSAREFRLTVPRDTTEAVRNTAQEAEVSEFTVYLAAFGTLLAHYAGEDQVSFASPFMDRPHLEMENSIGCFIRTLPVLIDVSPGLRVRDLLKRTRSEVMGLWRNLDFPVARKLSGLSSAGLFDISFVHDAYPELPEGIFTTAHPDEVHFPGRLTVTIEQLGDNTNIVIWYKESALTAERAARFAERLLVLIQQIPTHLDAPVTDLQPMSASERCTLLAASRETHYFDWDPTDLGTLFLNRTKADPARETWFDETRGYTNAWAHDAAVLVQHHILDAIGADKRPVAILLPRGATLLAAILGTVLSGHPYVPLSEHMPAARILDMLSDANAAIVITFSDLELELPDQVTRLNLDTCGDITALIDDHRDTIAEFPAPVDRAPEDLLYIEYTSGSTGRPKGVAITHANVQNTTLDLERRFPLGRDDVFLLKTSFTFDIFGTEIYGWLVGDGRLAILPVGQEGDPQALARAVRTYGVTHLNSSPTMLRVLLATVESTGRRHDLNGLTYLFSGGEALTPDIIERFFALRLPCTLENVYGPTEATMWATHTRIHPEDSVANAPIGTPLNDYRIYILNSRGDLCGTDLPGEVCIAGAGVGVGYLNREELTAEQFVENPFFDADIDPAYMRRMYRTGDLGFLRPDGRFAFSRRIDRQVKVGGLRVELGEIEQALNHIDGVVEAAVLVDESTAEPRLAGFYASGSPIPADRVRASLGKVLISQFIPSVLMQVEALPTSAAGKLDRAALHALLSQQNNRSDTSATTTVATRVADLWQDVLGRPITDHHRTFFEAGGTSLSLMRLQLRLQETFGAQIGITDLLSHPTIAAQADLVEPRQVSSEKSTGPTRILGDDIAIIGIGVQVQKAQDVHDFWKILVNGEETITFHDDDELRRLGVSENQLRDPNYVKASGRIEGIDEFDDRLFRIAPAEVDVTSPQLRLLYKCFWLACEDAGYDPRKLPGRVGVFAAGSDDFEWYRRTVMNPASFGDAYQNFTLATNHFLSTRLSYHFDLTGPSLSALSGCSSSLLTVHLAVQALRSGECDLAVAGGVTVELPNGGGYQWSDGMMLSRDGHCRPFDADASGTVFSNGAALLVLKPLTAARRDGDPIYAVIKGSASGNDGKRKQSYTAPSEDGQYETISSAYRTAGIDPATVSFVEAHGTGTLLGDPIEVASLSRAFSTAPVGGCLLGSVKGNIGHTDSAAGAVGLSKVALSLKHRLFPGTLNFSRPNPHINFSATPFEVSATNCCLDGRQIRAGINSFGVGGTNVHMILEEAPDLPETDDPPHTLLQFSGASQEAMMRTAKRIVGHVASDNSVKLADTAVTLRSRAELPHRGTLVVSPTEPRDADAWIKSLRYSELSAETSRPRVALLFSGQGNQYYRMGHGLYTSNSSVGRIFRGWMDDLTDVLPRDDARNLRDVLHTGSDDGRIHRTEWSQFALFSTQFALAKVLESFGIIPDVLLGHSIGELTAAALAGVWTPEDAARLVRERGLLMQSQPPGIMVATLAPATRVADVIAGTPDAWVCLDNSPERSVVGMAPHALDDVLAKLDAAGIIGTRLHTSQAFHTPMMEAAATAFTAAVAEVPSQDPWIPIISNRSGQLVCPGEMTDPGYWGGHITGAVRFADSIATLLADGPVLGIETGPGNSLATFVTQVGGTDCRVVGLVRHAASDVADEAHLLAGLGDLWGAGLSLDWSEHDPGHRRSLPGYSFDANPHPVSGGATTAPATTPVREEPRPIHTNRLDAFRDAFRQVLGHAEVSADDNFFALGGDSLKATSLTAQLKALVGVEATVADVFAAPTPAALEARLRKAISVTRMAKAPEAADYPLSPAQERMYLASRLDPDSVTYNMASATLLNGLLDHDRLRSALTKLVQRHEPLRTIFMTRDGEIRQGLTRIDQSDLPLSFTHGQVTPESVEEHLARFVRPFSLETGPLFRMEVVENEDTSLLLFDLHHIIGDATSAEILARDFGQLYDAELPPLTHQYTDYIHHIRVTQQNEELAKAENALLSQLTDPPTADVLPLDRPRAERASGASRVAWTLGPERTAKLTEIADARQATLPMVMLAAWGAVLSRYNGTEDLVIGTPVSGRTLAETREMIGMFVNMLPIRLKPRSNTSFNDYLTDTRTTMLDALSAQDVPFDRIVEKLGQQRTPGRHPLFDVSFDYHNMEHHRLHIGGLKGQQIETDPLAVGMDLVITATETTDGIQFLLDYSSDLFDGTTIEGLAHHFNAFLERVCADSTAPIGTISIYTEAEHDAWLSRLTGAPFTAIHDLVSRQVVERPQDTAVIDGTGRSYSFAQLDAHANAVAARLLEAGVRPGDPVALVTVRDVSLLIAQLAICKAGGAYVPLDPTQPVDRHASILDDARPRVALAPAGFASTAAIPTVIDLATCTRTGMNYFDGPKVSADNPVYVVYTSGSTGRPKGIAVKHRGLSNLFQDHLQRGIFAPGDVIISLADPTFDIFAFESLIPLASGATVHLCPTDDQKDASAIASRIATYGVTHIQVPVSKMTALCGNRRFRDQLPHLRVIVCGGEHFAENLVELLHERTDARIFNMYGPTETTVTTTVKELAPGDTITIGSPIFGSHILVVGDTGMAQPTGVPGELCIAGQGLAAGYVNRPDETRRAFTTLPELPDLPVYRTGDVGVALPNGEILLKGRTDHQVKVNGNRIELGEIEQTAMRAPGITYAIALVEDGDIVCYFTTDESAKDPVAAIRSTIAASLPSYMTPQHFHQVSDMPRLPNNKIDRSALRTLRNTPRPAPKARTRSDVLDVIINTWAQVLDRDVTVDDNFFDIGGSSFKLMLVNNRLNEALDREIPLVQLFEYTTPRALAAMLDNGEQPEPPQAEATFSLEDLSDIADQGSSAPGLSEDQDSTASRSRRIAVVGVAGTFPGAASVREHWDNRANGVVSIHRFTRDELLASGIDQNTIDHPDYVPARGHIAADTFDFDFFSYSQRDAETMDPQLRLLHETAWHTLEDAGYDPRQLHGDVALFAGSGTNFTWLAGLLQQHSEPMAAFEAMTNNEKDFLATKVAYKLGLKGPAVTVQTACSTSLVAIHEAVACLRRGEADMALAGGVALNFPRVEGYLWHDGMILSPDGTCRPFSSDASGTVGGQGCGMVLLKPLDRALSDGDHIYAVIVGSAINNDGDAKVGYTAPGVQGQERVIRSALADAGIGPDEVDFVETHGTGTSLGDPIEYAALSHVYGKSSPCALGAVKANIGHLDAAAGVAGFLGAVGALHQQQIPPLANFTGLNEAIDPAGQLYVPVGKTVAGPVRRAAVSSFGIGGTNAHVILEQAPSIDDGETSLASSVILGISARTEESRRRMQSDLVDAIGSGAPIRDVAYTLATGRSEFASRAAALVFPGAPLKWMDADTPAVVGEASDDVHLVVANQHDSDDALVGAYLEQIELWLSRFDAKARAAVQDALKGRSGDGLVCRIAQFVLRAALLSTLGPDCLTARRGQDRLLRVARAHATGVFSSSQALSRLRSHDISVPALPPVEDATMMTGPITGDLLRTLLASLWVRGADVNRSWFHIGGRRISLPGYAFSPQHLTSDVRLDQLLGSTEQTDTASAAAHVLTGPTETQDAEDALKAAWTKVIGTVPEDADDFLTSGGDSLTAIHLCSLVKKTTGRTLTVRDVFSTPTFGALRARLVGSVVRNPAPEPTVETVHGVFPASSAQRRMYALCSMRNDTTAYNMALDHKVTGRLDVDRLRQACAALVSRHDQLRTSFHLEGAELMMHVHSEVPDVVSQEHVTAQEALRRLAAGPEPFDLACAPLFRVEVLSVSETEHYLRLDLHHIVGDQTSLAVLGKDLADAWAGREPDVAPLPYPTYMATLAELEASGAFAEDVAFFNDMIANAPMRLELPYDHALPEEPSFAGERLTIDCAVGKESLRQLATASRATPYAVFLTAVTRVLSLFSGQSEFLVGTALSGRTLAGAENTVGMFVNTLPLRVRNASDLSVRDAVRATRDHAAEVLSHQNAPFEQVLASSGIPVDECSQPLFDALISFVNMGTEDLAIEGLELEVLPPCELHSRYPLSFSIAEHTDHYSIDIEYQSELFDRSTITTMAGHLDQLLAEMTKDPDRRLALVPLESAEEHARRRAALTGGGYPITTALDTPLDASFTRYARLPALRWEGEEWTYTEVERITGALAGGLQQAGVAPGDVVGTVLDRGPWQVWSRLALARCGAVELPLDPDAPLQRINQTLSDARATTVLCTDPQRHTFPEDVTVHRPELLSGNFQPPSDLGPASPLIMIYTSGTTGRPKGVLVTHGGVLSACTDTGYMNYGPGDRVLHLTRYTFDPSMFDIYSALLSGATIVMGSHAHNMDTRLLADLLVTEKITKGLLITAVFHLLMAEHPEAVAGMSALFVGGEAMQPWAAQRAYKVMGPGRLFNLYGPTESSIVSTFFRMDEYPDFQRMPIGFPTNNRELFVVHPDGTDVPRGIPGELCIAGAGLAQGYHQRAELTDEKFPDSLGTLSKRVYRTGDRVVLDDEYRVVYLDRVDRQVKHAGYRIELSEIEIVAQSHPKVVEAVIIHTSTGANDSRLLGFYTGDAVPSDLRTHLQSSLPSYMVPQQLLRVEEFPLTGHGKVDRHRLLALCDTAPEVRAEQPSPTAGPSPDMMTEEASQDILAMARAIFGMPELSATANFFALGVQSIQAIALTRKLRESGIEAQVSDIYRYPSVVQLTQALRAPGSSSCPTVPVTPKSSTRRLTQQHLDRLAADIVMDASDLAEAFACDAPSYRFDAGVLSHLHASHVSTGGFVHTVGDTDATTLLEALADIVADHEMLRARSTGDGFDVIPAETVADLPVLIRVHDLSRLPADQVIDIINAVARDLTSTPFGSGLLWRCAIILEPENSARLIWAFHHSIFDGFSAQLLHDELQHRVLGDEVPPAQRYSAFLTDLAGDHDWDDELRHFDYSRWLASNESVTAALRTSEPLPRRLSVPLKGQNPLDLGLRSVHSQLAELSNESEIAVGIVSDCRQWQGTDYSSCVGEFLDAVPVMLSGKNDQQAITERLTNAKNHGLHYLHALFTATQRDEKVLEQLRSTYHGDDGKLGFILVNFQGYLAPADLPSNDITGPTLATAQVNLWYDDDALHMQWITNSAQLVAGGVA